MFAALGRTVANRWLAWLAAWALLLALLWTFAPDWKSVTKPGEFDFLPSGSPSRIGSDLFQKAFPDEPLGSSVVLITYRDDKKLEPADEEFVQSTLAPRLRKLRESAAPAPSAKSLSSTKQPALVVGVRDASEAGLAPLLDSGDGKATLVVADLRGDFLSSQTAPAVARIERLLDELKQQHAVPVGLRMALSGSAVVGRDIERARAQSAKSTELWTVVLVVLLLLLVYRAPLLALVPLVTLFVAFKVCLSLVATIAAQMKFGLFQGLDVYAMVLAYGVGVDYTLFLISRVHEELRNGADERQAIETALARVGSAISASAATGIFGIAMMVFATFGKFRQAGLTIAFALFVMLCAALTLTPALLRLGRRWLFWPERIAPARADPGPGRIDGAVQVNIERATPAAASLGAKTPQRKSRVDAFWQRTGRFVVRRPGIVWMLTILALGPFAAYAAINYNHLDYGLITQLPRQAPSVVGTEVIAAHFPAGATGPATVLLQCPQVDFSDPDNIDRVGALTKNLLAHKQSLDIADLRSVSEPLGATPQARHYFEDEVHGIAAKAEVRAEAIDHYVGAAEGKKRPVTRLDVVLSVDPFARQSIPVLERLEEFIKDNLPRGLQGGNLYAIGPTSSIRDLKVVANQDRVRINVLVVVAVLAVLLGLRLGVGISIYLVFTVLFSYLASLGVSFVLFRAFDPEYFPGLDWTVPLFLFTVLVAVGVDYNIFLMSRIREETGHHGSPRGIAEAVSRTGGIISSCGLIMAGTFSSLLVGGKLAQMYQLGFALSFGILLDTFVVRPLLVPSFLVLIRRRKPAAATGQVSERIPATLNQRR